MTAFRDQMPAKIRDIPAIEHEAWADSVILTAPDGYRITFFTRVPRRTLPAN